MTIHIAPDFDVVGRDMAEVQRNLAKLTADDQNARAEFMKRPEVPSEYKVTPASEIIGGRQTPLGPYGSLSDRPTKLRCGGRINSSDSSRAA